MTTPHDDGGPAYPVPTQSTITGGSWSWSDGMSLRDWFAGMAMQGLLIDPACTAPSLSVCARVAYEMADAMIDEKRRREGK